MSDTLSVATYGAPGFLGGTWTPAQLSNLELWLRPEELANPNRLLQTADLTDAAWTNTTITVAASQTDPDGGSTAFKLTPAATGSNLQQAAQGFQVSSDDVAHLWWKRAAGHNGTSKATISLSDGVGSTDENSVPPASWTQLTTLTRTLDGSATDSTIEIFPDSDTGTQAIEVWHPQLEAGTSASAYVENGATAGGLVATWADQSTNGNDATQGTQAAMPLVQAAVLDGYSGALNDGVDDILNLDSQIDFAGAYELWAVVKANANQFGLYGLSTTNFAGRVEVANQITARPGGAAAATLTATGVFPAASPYLIRIRRDGSDDFICEKNGVDVTTGTPNRAGTVSVTKIGAIGSFADGYFIEAYLSSALLSAEEVTNSKAYFSGRYATLGI